MALPGELARLLTGDGLESFSFSVPLAPARKEGRKEGREGGRKGGREMDGQRQSKERSIIIELRKKESGHLKS